MDSIETVKNTKALDKGLALVESFGTPNGNRTHN